MQVAHYAKVDAQGFSFFWSMRSAASRSMCPEAVSDPDAGTMSLSAGVQTLSRRAGGLFLPSERFSSAEQQRGMNEALAIQALQEIREHGQARFLHAHGRFRRPCEKTDMDVKAAYGMLSSLKGVAAESVDGSHADVSPRKPRDTLNSRFRYPDEWSGHAGPIHGGRGAFQRQAGTSARSIPHRSTIAVNNGGSVEGAASDAASCSKARASRSNPSATLTAV